jgi:site-specific DNA-cytosine methylase
VLFAGKHTHFRINELNGRSPTLDEFLHDLEVIDKVAAEEGSNFLVLFLSPAFLHPSAVSRFSDTILGLLKIRYSVHMKIVQVKQFGLPQERNILIIVASPICAPLPWKDERYTVQATDVVGLSELIADLNFGNERMVNKECSGFVCSPPQDDRRAGSSSLVHIYNHYTGIGVADRHGHVQVGPTTNLKLDNGPKQWKHPGPCSATSSLSLSSLLTIITDRPDRLTVRELARVQGIPDDFKFWGPIESQYEAVCKAIPPVIAKMVADTILQAIRNTLTITVAATRRNKRPRVAVAEERD